MKLRFLFTLFCFANISFAQNNKQNIRGNITDKLSQSPIIGATVQILNNTEKNGTQTDVNGQYVLLNLAPNRYEIKVSYVGYKEVVVPNVVVTSGKEVILDVTMEEDLRLLNEVVVKASNKANTVNKLASISARTFSMEEVNRYAGGRSDPARLAANFAGLSIKAHAKHVAWAFCVLPAQYPAYFPNNSTHFFNNSTISLSLKAHAGVSIVMYLII